MLHIAGGTYAEICREPNWDQLMGSGLRAALALRLLSDKIYLHTYLTAQEHAGVYAYLGPLSGTHEMLTEVQVESRPTSSTIRFRYAHGLARPVIDPPLHLLPTNAPLRVESANVLRFGMLEGSAVVHGERVVYDPQATHNPEPYDANGSTAETLAIVANYREGRNLTGETEIAAIGTALRNRHGAAVVVLKQGALGASVFDDSGTAWVPALKTPRVWPIGSGDIFSAAFAHYWGEKLLTPADAAARASEAAAYYCSTRRLPIPREMPTGFVASLAPVRDSQKPGTTAGRRKPVVYLAGPFFTMAERWLVHQARDALRSVGIDVFSPFHDVGIGSADEVVPEDVAKLDECQAVLALVDRSDAGTLFEIGYARAQGTPVVAFVQVEFEEPLKMLRGTACVVEHDFTTAIYQAAWYALEGLKIPVPLPDTRTSTELTPST